MMEVLLIEPAYKNKYPPIGLMKISHFLKSRGHDVVFFKGCSEVLRDEFNWDYILITSLFTFEWKITVDTIRFYQQNASRAHVACGGILASLMPDQLKSATGVHVVTGLLDRPNTFGIEGEEEIEYHIPDYAMLDDVDYEYPVADSYFVHFTRGCVNRCKFCAVPELEPTYESYRPALIQIERIDREYGKKQNLLIMDNNTVASPYFSEIVADITEAGFGRGAMLNNKQRVVDFNQGLDARHFTQEKMKLVATLAIKPLRIAFDDIRLREVYVRCMRWAAESGLWRLSNYVLYNYRDTPEDFYERMRINIDLNEELGTSIYSFPMKYSPIYQTHRRYVGTHWNWRYLRAIKCILQATHGVVGTKRQFFHHAFGSSVEEFLELLVLPEEYIVNRVDNEETSNTWREELKQLSDEEKDDFGKRVLNSRYPKMGSNSPAVERLLTHYYK